MPKHLRDITLYCFGENLPPKVAAKNNVISDLYIHYLKPYSTQKVEWISIELGESEFISPLSRVVSVHLKFDFNQFQILDDIEQNLMVLNTIHKAAMLCAAKFGWDANVFLDAYNSVVSVNYIYRVETPKKTSRDKKHKASLVIEKNETNTTIAVLFYDNKEQLLSTVELLITFNWGGFQIPIIKTNKWFDNLSFGISLLNAQLVIRASLNESKPFIDINPKDLPIEEIEGVLRQITYQYLPDKKSGIDWANK
jgi:hypothetical protein